MANGALDIALGQGRAALSPAEVERLQNLLALQAGFLVAIEDDDIAMRHSLQAKFVLDESKVDVELAEHIGKLAVVVEGDFNPIQGLRRLRLCAWSPSLITRACVHRALRGRCFGTG